MRAYGPERPKFPKQWEEATESAQPSSFNGFTLHHRKRWHLLNGKGMCAIRFWVLYKAKQDGPIVLGWCHPWDGHRDHGIKH